MYIAVLCDFFRIFLRFVVLVDAVNSMLGCYTIKFSDRCSNLSGQITINLGLDTNGGYEPSKAINCAYNRYTAIQ